MTFVAFASNLAGHLEMKVDQPPWLDVFGGWSFPFFPMFLLLVNFWSQPKWMDFVLRGGGGV